MIRFVDAPEKYDAANERQFRNQLDQALRADKAEALAARGDSVMLQSDGSLNWDKL